VRNFAALSMLYCSNSKGRSMEPEHRKDQDAAERAKTERTPSNAEKPAFTVPFASEGLERVRDSHC
jgi:hypothetical protein